MRIVSHKEGWALLVDKIEEPAWVVRTKKRAVESARVAAEFHRCKLDICTRSGSIQKHLDFGATHTS